MILNTFYSIKNFHKMSSMCFHAFCFMFSCLKYRCFFIKCLKNDQNNVFFEKVVLSQKCLELFSIRIYLNLVETFQSKNRILEFRRNCENILQKGISANIVKLKFGIFLSIWSFRTIFQLQTSFKHYPSKKALFRRTLLLRGSGCRK